MQRIIITLGLVTASISVLYPYLQEIGIGRLPGKIILRGENSTFNFSVELIGMIL